MTRVLIQEMRCGLARVLRRTARWLDNYPVEFLGQVYGERKDHIRRVPPRSNGRHG